jgi:AcrR family transcriptional regulator
MARTQADRKATTRSLLLDAATELFATRGIDAVSVEAIADAADRTSGAVYAHFGGKAGLVTAVLDEWKDRVAVVVAAAFETSPQLESRLDALWTTFADPPDDRGGEWLLLEHELWLRAARDPEIRAPLAARYADARGATTDEFSRWVAEFGLEPAVPIEQLPVLVLGLLLGLEMQRRIDPAAVTDEIALAGLLALFRSTSEGTDR